MPGTAGNVRQRHRYALPVERSRDRDGDVLDGAKNENWPFHRSRDNRIVERIRDPGRSSSKIRRGKPSRASSNPNRESVAPSATGAERWPYVSVRARLPRKRSVSVPEKRHPQTIKTENS